MEFSRSLILFIALCVGCTTFEFVQSEPAASYSSSKLALCTLTMEASCFLDATQEMVDAKRAQLLVEADAEVASSRALRAIGGDDDEETPSNLAESINKIFAEFTSAFKETFSGYLFKSGRESDVEDSDDEDEEEENRSNSDDDEEEAKKAVKRADKTEARKKKKKHKIHTLIKSVILGIFIILKVKLLFKLFSAALQVKFFIVAFLGLVLNAARFYLDLKKGHQPQKVVYYEHAQHQHNYEEPEEEWGHGGGYWGRSYEVEKEGGEGGVASDVKTAQDLAYAKQKPSAEKTNYHWL